MFCDRVDIFVKAGSGGNGHLSFLHEKYREFGGPDGGDGGNGGNVIFKVDSSWNTLYHYKTNRNQVAENGEEGKKRKKHGRNGHDLIVPVPVGTVVFNSDTDEQLADLNEIGSEYIVAYGGEGGYGNAHFTSSTRQTPRFAEYGIDGDELNIRLELKLIADVGLVGLPNIGKSTFLSVVSSARPKIADYPFTTIIPNLGVVEAFGAKGFVIADMPGLIEGAAQGKGLGDEFLRHIERTRVIVHLISATTEDIEQDFNTINKELAEYNSEILKKPQILVISKIDEVDDSDLKKIEKKANKIIADNPEVFKFDKKPYLISSILQQGLKELIFEIAGELENIPKKLDDKKTKIYTLKDVVDNRHRVKNIDGELVVESSRLERFVLKTDFNNPYGVMRIYDIMTKMGIIKDLGRKGAKIGDKVRILDKYIDYKG